MAYHPRAFDTDREARTAILSAVRDTEHLRAAAALMAVSYKTLRRYVVRLALDGEIAAIYARRASERDKAKRKKKAG